MSTINIPSVTCHQCNKPMNCFMADNEDGYWKYSCDGCGLHLDLAESEDDE